MKTLDNRKIDEKIAFYEDKIKLLKALKADPKLIEELMDMGNGYPGHDLLEENRKKYSGMNRGDATFHYITENGGGRQDVRKVYEALQRGGCDMGTGDYSFKNFTITISHDPRLNYDTGTKTISLK